MARPKKYISKAKLVVIEDMRSKGELVPNNIPYKDLADLVAKHYKLEWSGGSNVAYAVIYRASGQLNKLQLREAGRQKAESARKQIEQLFAEKNSLPPLPPHKSVIGGFCNMGRKDG